MITSVRPQIISVSSRLLSNLKNVDCIAGEEPPMFPCEQNGYVGGTACANMALTWCMMTILTIDAWNYAVLGCRIKLWSKSIEGLFVISWPQLISTSLSWSQIASTGLNWPQLALTGLSWPLLDSAALKWSKLTSTDLSWPQLSSNVLSQPQLA